ncbi:hypothetical protein ACA910_004039 [Epithemia clementina (nom. ined.)]
MNRLEVLNGQVDKLGKRTDLLEHTADPQSIQHRIALVVSRELNKVERILVDAQDFFHRGGLANLPLRIAQVASQSHPLSDDEKQEWQHQRREVRDLLDKVLSEQADLAMNIKDLAARADGQMVEIDGITYQSLSFVQGFVCTENIAEHVLKFVDSVSLMEMATSMSEKFAENVETQFRGNRVNLAIPLDQKSLFSFQLEVSTALGGQPKQAAAEAWKLLMFKTYETFHGTGSMDTGKVNHLKKVLDYRVLGLTREIRQSPSLSKDAQNLALALMSDAKAFLESLFTFMD